MQVIKFSLNHQFNARSHAKVLEKRTLQDQTCSESSSMALSCLVANFFGPTEMLKNKTSHFRFVNILYMSRVWTLCVTMCWKFNINNICINRKLVLQTIQSEGDVHILMIMCDSEKVKRRKCGLKMQMVDFTWRNRYLGLATLWRACWTSYQVTLRAEATATPWSPPLQSSVFLSEYGTH